MLCMAMVVGAAVAASGCDQRSSPETVGQKMDRATDKVASTTSNAANKAADAMDDAALTAKVKAAIIAEPGLRSLEIGVDTKDSVVTLSGSVTAPPMKERAKEVAANVTGVRSVVDNLVTKSS
jgi:osmotically-inducible protein OsmY